MNVELTIQDCFDKFPAMFKERADVLNQLFVVLGNGYDWINGELVDPDFKITKTYLKELQSHLVNGKAFQHNKLSLRGESIYYRELRKAEGHKDLFEDIFTPEEIEEMEQKYLQSLPDDIYHKEPRRKRWYCHREDKEGNEYVEWCEDYIYLFNYPNDIKEDWKAAIEETKTLLREDGFSI